MAAAAALFSVAGTRFYIGGPMTARSASFGVADFAGQSWVAISWVEDLGQFGDEAAELTSTPLDGTNLRKMRGYVDAGGMTLVMGRDYSDPGQSILVAARRLPYDYAFRVLFPDNFNVRYFLAKVLSFQEQFDTVNNVIRGRVALAIGSNVVAAQVGVTNLSPAAGSLSLIGNVPLLPQVSSSVTITPPVGALALTRNAPITFKLVQPGTGTLALAGTTARSNQQLIIGSAALTLTPTTPDVLPSLSFELREDNDIELREDGDFELREEPAIVPDSAALRVVGNAPGVRGPVLLTLSTNAPVLITNHHPAIAARTLALSPNAPVRTP